MTQRNNSAHNRLHDNQSLQVWHRSLPAQSLCWLSSFSLLSGGLVFAQESPIDNIVPTVENSSSAASVNKVKFEQNHKASTPEADQAQPDYSQRRAKLKQRLNRGEISQTQNEGKQQHSQASRESSQRIASPETGVSSKLRVKLQATQQVPVIHKQQAQVAAPTAPSSFSQQVPQAAKLSNNSHSVGSGTADRPKDYNNSLIDPTNYGSMSAARKYKYEAPSAVVITDRTSGCRTTLAQGQGVANSLCAKLPYQSVADSETKLQQKQPSWMRRSQIAHSVTVNSDEHVSSGETNITRSPRINASGVSNITRSPRIATGGVTKSDYKPNRFIPNNFITPTTTVSSTPLAPAGGALPPPLTSDNVAPRASTVAYNIPLASTLPQIAYSGVSRLAANVTGLMFPLAVPAPITSLFGWRIHPITGDRRFHSGTDLGAAIGTPVLAAYAGKVEMADWVGGYGLTVILNHNNAQQTLYGHMSQILVQPGQWVEQGTVVGLVGSTGNSTGPHLHFEVRQLTPDGWVATDPGAQLEYALSQLVQGLQTAQASKPTSRRLN
jgi:murein DD-endopeptidase MepM/ murein hydrolase activator NlpD